MGIAHDAVKAVGRKLGNVRAGADKLLARKVASELSPRIVVASSAFAPNAPLPRACTSDGEGSPPPLAWANAPAETRSFVVVCEDPDAPLPDPFVHWIAYGIPAAARGIDAQSVTDWTQGKNTKLSIGFTPAAPPPGHGLHHYHFQVFALDEALDLDAGAGRGELLDRMQGHVLAWGELVGTYRRK
jgi:Raf kinase inhibitor-like YbhB/YbcL family protein